MAFTNSCSQKSLCLVFFSPNLENIEAATRRVLFKKGVLENFARFTGKHLCHSLFFNKVAGLRPTTLLKKRLWHRCFLVNFAKFLRAPFLHNTYGRLLLIITLSFSKLFKLVTNIAEFRSIWIKLALVKQGVLLV